MVALKAEAQAFVDKFKLKNYKNSKLCVTVSGVGKENMQKATREVLKNLTQDDIIINVGICGAGKNYAVGKLLINPKISCVDYEVSKNKFDIVDMESDGFLQATKDTKNRYIFKVVSDHFEPKKVTKDGAKKLIFNKIDEIMKKVEDESSCNGSQ